jgi:hypothetical protein
VSVRESVPNANGVSGGDDDSGEEEEGADGEWVQVVGALTSPRAVQGAAKIDAPDVADRGMRINPAVVRAGALSKRSTTVVDVDALDDSEPPVNDATPVRRATGALVSRKGIVGNSTRLQQPPPSRQSAWLTGSNDDDEDDFSVRRLSGHMSESHIALMTAIGRAFDLLNAYTESPEVSA